ncbi:MAG: HD domain-containing protein [Candidatus Nitrosocosmicus sp.]|nr:HD domain-containing protein [Candidatus Nitrosocosmicus sp.]
MPVYHPFLNFTNSIRLAEYGYIGITSIEKKIIDTKFFQRLRRIKQSSNLFMAFPGASHSRFEHSLGAMHVAGEASTYIILNSNNTINSTSIIDLMDTIDCKNEFKKQIQITRLAALLHDIGHAPFSHTFEEFLKLVNPSLDWKHEYLSLEIIYDKFGELIFKLSENTIESYEVMSLLCDLSPDLKIIDKTKKVLEKVGVRKEIIAKMDVFLQSNWYLNFLVKEDPYNVDRFNYLILDSNRTGAKEYGFVDVGRIIQNLYYLEKDKIVTVSTQAKEAAMRFFEAYSQMHRSIYLHKVSQGADIHLSYIMKEVAKESDTIFHKLTNPQMEILLELSDDVLIYELSKTKNEKTKKLVNDYLNRNILSLVHEFDLSDNNKITRIMDTKGSKGLQDEIKKESGLADNSVVLVINITNKKATKPPVDEPTLKRLMFYNTKSKKLESLDLDFIKQLYPNKKYRIFVEKEDKERIKEILSEWLED